MAPTQVSRKKESKADRLARKGANEEQLKSLVNNLEGTFHQRKMTPATLRHHNVVWQNWQDFAITIGISPEITLHQQPPSEGKWLPFINAPSPPTHNVPSSTEGLCQLSCRHHGRQDVR
jgi:hypothetical protein